MFQKRSNTFGLTPKHNIVQTGPEMIPGPVSFDWLDRTRWEKGLQRRAGYGKIGVFAIPVL